MLAIGHVPVWLHLAVCHDADHTHVAEWSWADLVSWEGWKSGCASSHCCHHHRPVAEKPPADGSNSPGESSSHTPHGHDSDGCAVCQSLALASDVPRIATFCVVLQAAYERPILCSDRPAQGVPLLEFSAFTNQWQDDRHTLVNLARGIEFNDLPFAVTEVYEDGTECDISVTMLRNILSHFREIELQTEHDTMLELGEIKTRNNSSLTMKTGRSDARNVRDKAKPRADYRMHGSGGGQPSCLYIALLL